MSRKGPLGIFGGTFNPVHNGHLRSALEVRESLGLEQVLLVPAAEPPLRAAPECSAALRAELVELAVATEPGLACDSRELDRPGPSYTVDTLAELRAEQGSERSLCLIVGTDILENLDRWHRWEDLLSLAHLVVMARPGWQHPQSGTVATWLDAHRGENVDLLHQQASGAVFLQTLRQLPISATEIREMIGAGRSPRYLVPDAVWEKIQLSGAYGGAQPQQEQHGIC